MEKIILNPDGFVELPQPDEISKNDRDTAMGSYLMLFAAFAVGLPFPFLNLLASIIYYYVNKKESRFVNFHLYQSNIIQLLMSIVNCALIVWLVILAVHNFIDYKPFVVFLIFSVIWNIYFIIFSIVACIRSKDGRFCYLPVFGKIIFDKFYGSKAQAMQYEEKKAENRPPAGF